CEVPALSHNPAALGVINSEYSLLSFVQRNVLSGSAFHGGAELGGCNPQLSDDTNIVEQACQVSFPRLGKPDFARELPANKRAAKRVFPKNNWVEARRLTRQKCEYGTGHGDITHALHSQRHDRCANAIDLLPLSEHINVNHVGAGIKRKIPDVFDNHRAGNAPAGSMYYAAVLLEEQGLSNRAIGAPTVI